MESQGIVLLPQMIRGVERETAISCRIQALSQYGRSKKLTESNHGMLLLIYLHYKGFIGIFAGIPKVVHQVHGQIASIGTWTQPHQNPRGALVNLAHQLDLMHLFGLILLVDADGIDP